MSFFDDERKKGTYDVEAEDPTGTDEGKGADEGTPAEETPYAFEDAPAGKTGDEETAEEEAMRLEILRRRSTTRASISLLLALLSFCCCGLPLSLTALVLIIVDLCRRRIFDGLTVTALVLSIVAVVVSIVSVIYATIFLQMISDMLAEGGIPGLTTAPVTTVTPPVTTAPPATSGPVISLPFRIL